MLFPGRVALAASLTCASVALANAGIEMYDLVVGCSAVSNYIHQWNNLSRIFFRVEDLSSFDLYIFSPLYIFVKEYLFQIWVLLHFIQYHINCWQYLYSSAWFLCAKTVINIHVLLFNVLISYNNFTSCAFVV